MIVNSGIFTLSLDCGSLTTSPYEGSETTLCTVEVQIHIKFISMFCYSLDVVVRCFVGVEMAMEAVENQIGRVLSIERIVDLGRWVGTLGARFPGLRVVVEKEALWFVVTISCSVNGMLSFIMLG